jgi:Flp pilus assembly pilin Flp
MSTGELLDGTFATIRRNPAATLGLSAIFVTVQQLLFAGIQLLTGELSAPEFTFRTGSDTEVGLTLTGLLSYPLGAVVAALLTGMVAVVIMADVQGQRTSLGQAWQAIRPRLGALLVTSLLAGALPYVGLVLLVAPGVMLWGFWAVATPVLLMEGTGPLAALRRSWRLVRRDFWRVWGIRALSVLIGLLMQVILVLPFALAATLLGQLDDSGATEPGLLFLALSVAGNIVAGTVVAPFKAGVQALLYVDRRMRAEALDIVWQRQLAATRGRPL